MKTYQLVASGYFTINHARYMAYSHEVYRTEEAARAAIPAYFKLLTIPKKKDDTTVMAKEGLRIFINPLELVNNKKGGK